MSDFYKYFKENMDGLGLPSPDSLFSSAQTAVGTVSVLMSAIEKFGRVVTIREVIGAGTGLEGLAVTGACSAAYYAGAVVGSIAVATGRTMNNGTSLADVMFIAKQNDWYVPWLRDTLHRAPHLYNGSTRNVMVRAAHGKR